MKYFTLILGLVFAFESVFAQQETALPIVFEQNTWEQVLQKAKNENKLVFIDVSATNCPVCEQTRTSVYSDENVGQLYNSNFINYHILPQDDKYSFLVNRYNIKTYPTYLYIKPDGVLVHSASDNLTTNDFVKNGEHAIALRNELKPMVQWDLEYKLKKNDHQFLFNYIEKRTSLAYDNADVIDQYTTIAQDKILKASTLTLLLKKNEMNANGAFFRFILANQEKVKNVLKINDIRLNQILANSIDYSFNKACNAKNELLLDAVINARLACTSETLQENSEIVRNEYRTKFYYTTKQPVLLSNYVTLYANTILSQGDEAKEVIEDELDEQHVHPLNKKALFPSTFSERMMRNASTINDVEELDVAYSFKLRDAAQYVVEMLSNKKMLDNALVWSKRAIELFDNFSNYETHAYVLYKLGKRSEAIASMEKAYEVAPLSEGSARRQVEAKLIKMKRGERIW